RPFAERGEGRRPTLTWPREIPIEGHPADVTAIALAYADWLSKSQVPKLFVKAEPGLLIAAGANLEFARSLPAQTEVTVAGLHFGQEDAPHEIGGAIAGWMRTLGGRRRRMVAWDRVTRAEVLRAIKEYDRLGAEQFFARHGFAPPTTYELAWEQRRSPPK